MNNPSSTRTLTVVTQSVLSVLTPEQLEEAYAQLQEKSKIQDPDNPNLWTAKVAGHELWAILDEGVGPQGEEVLTILFPSDY